jgi:hypothetical protein
MVFLDLLGAMVARWRRQGDDRPLRVLIWRFGDGHLRRRWRPNRDGRRSEAAASISPAVRN